MAEGSIIGLKLREVARNLCVDISTVHRVNRMFLITGAVSKKCYPTDRPTKKMTDDVKSLVLNTVIEEPL